MRKNGRRIAAGDARLEWIPGLYRDRHQLAVGAQVEQLFAVPAPDWQAWIARDRRALTDESV